MILTIFKILKIHYKHFWMEFLNKYTLVYSKYVSVKTCIAQKPYLQSKSIDNWLLYDTSFFERYLLTDFSAI